MKRTSSSIALIAATLLGVSVNAAPVNLVPNGDFESGNSQFTSDYAYTPGGNGAEGQYTVRSNPFPWNGFFISTGDHTSGTGQMMVVNGSPVAGAVVWRSQAIAVTGSTSYFFEAFVNNVCCQGISFGAGSESILEFSLSLDGGSPISLGTITTDLALAGTWEGLSTQFIAPSSGNVELRLINRNTNAGGNDFAIDDVYFGTESTVNPIGVPAPAAGALLLAAMCAFATRRRAQADQAS